MRPTDLWVLLLALDVTNDGGAVVVIGAWYRQTCCVSSSALDAADGRDGVVVGARCADGLGGVVVRGMATDVMVLS